MFVFLTLSSFYIHHRIMGSIHFVKRKFNHEGQNNGNEAERLVEGDLLYRNGWMAGSGIVSLGRTRWFQRIRYQASRCGLMNSFRFSGTSCQRFEWPSASADGPVLHKHSRALARTRLNIDVSF
jgi:hypothetical protein